MAERPRGNKAPLKDRLTAFAEEAREKAKSAVGPERDVLLRKARRAETAADIDDWANSPSLQSLE
jgi:hypothetical protein